MLRAPVKRALAVCTLIPMGAWAADQNLGQPPANKTEIFVTAGIGETDNVGLTATGTQSQTLAAAGVLLDVERQGPLLQANLKGDLTYLDYLEHFYSGQVVGRFDGNLSFALLPDHIKWVLQDDYGTAQVDALAPVDRTNIQSVNVVSTGPDLSLRPSDNSFVHLGGRYVLVDYQTSPFNSHRVLGTASIGDELSVASSVSLNADVSQIRFQDTTINPNYDRRKFFLRYDTRGARTTIALDAGVAQVDDTGRWNSKLIAQLVLTRDLTPHQSASLSGGRQFTDSSDSFQTLTSGAAGNTIVAPVAGGAGNYLVDYGAAEWRFTGARTRIAVSGRWERDAYTIVATPLQVENYILAGIPVGLDATRSDLEARVQRDITPILSADARASYVHENFETLGFVDHTVIVGIGLTFRPNARLQYRVRFDHTVRTPDTVPTSVVVQGLGTGFTENRIFLTAVYRLSESTETAPDLGRLRDHSP
jgi:hypothetical protein